MLNNGHGLEDISIPASSLFDNVPKWECHIHTNHTDGSCSVDDIVRKGINLGLELLIFTEHTEPWKTRSEDWFPEYLEEVKTAKNKYGHSLKILCGIEAPATDFSGGLLISKEMMEKVDIVFGSAHRYPGIGNRRVQDMRHEELIEYEYKTLVALAKNPRVDVIAHIGGTCKKYGGPFPEALSREVIRAAVKFGKIIEINHNYHEPLAGFVHLCAEESARVTIGSDVHTLEEIGEAYNALAKMAAHSYDPAN